MTEPASPADRTLLALANRLVDSAGRGRANALSRLDGGKNNQVYRVETDAGDIWQANVSILNRDAVSETAELRKALQEERDRAEQMGRDLAVNKT